MILTKFVRRGLPQIVTWWRTGARGSRADSIGRTRAHFGLRLQDRLWPLGSGLWATLDFRQIRLQASDFGRLTSAERRKGARAQRHKGARAQRHNGTTEQRNNGTRAQRNNGGTEQRFRLRFERESGTADHGVNPVLHVIPHFAAKRLVVAGAGDQNQPFGSGERCQHPLGVFRWRVRIC